MSVQRCLAQLVAFALALAGASGCGAGSGQEPRTADDAAVESSAADGAPESGDALLDAAPVSSDAPWPGEAAVMEGSVLADAPASVDGSLAPSDASAPPLDPYAAVFASVDKANLQRLLGEITGVTPVTVNGQTFSITERWSPAGKANFRAYWIKYFADLGAAASEIPFPIDPSRVDPQHRANETMGHNLEAILPGTSPDTLVIVVHYDSVGATPGQETQNPAADDDGSGLVTQMEAARILAAQPKRANTVRFVAADYEETTNNAYGDVVYVPYLQAQAKAGNFKILAVADNDQEGWSCWDENRCNSGAPTANSTFVASSCLGAHDFPALTQGLSAIAAKYSTIQVEAKCGTTGTDHVPFIQAGIPSYEIEEYDYADNPRYDVADDTVAHIDFDYLFHIAQVTITYQATLVGLP